MGVTADAPAVLPGPPALDGLLVLELGRSLACVLAGMLLADNGARVIKLESPGGSPERARPGHRVWNRGKQSVLLDFSLPTAQTIFEQLLARADVAVWDAHAETQVLATVSERESFSAAHPRLITAEVTGAGLRAPGAQGTAAGDALVAARLGRCCDQTGWEPGPSHVVAPMPSVAAALLLVHGITAGVLARSAAGHGLHVSTSLVGASLAISGAVLTDAEPAERGLSPDPRGSSPFYAAYACRDDAWIQIGCLHAGFVRRAIDVLDEDGALGRLAADPGFGDGVIVPDLRVRAAAYAAMERALLGRERAAWLAALDAADVPAAAVQATEPFLDDPQARANGLAEVADPTFGPILQAGGFVRLSDTPARVGAGAPVLGEHTAAVAAELSADV